MLSSTPKEAEVMSDFISTQASFSPTVEYGLTTEKNSNGVCIFFSLFFLNIRMVDLVFDQNTRKVL